MRYFTRVLNVVYCSYYSNFVWQNALGRIGDIYATSNLWVMFSLTKLQNTHTHTHTPRNFFDIRLLLISFSILLGVMSIEGIAVPPTGLILVTHEPGSVTSAPGPHIRGSTLRAYSVGDKEVDLLLPGTGRYLITHVLLSNVNIMSESIFCCLLLSFIVGYYGLSWIDKLARLFFLRGTEQSNLLWIYICWIFYPITNADIFPFLS